MKRWTALILTAIVALALFLRINGVAQNPPSLTWDEVSIGYNAYSILKTGRDEHGRYLPLDTFIAYGDYKPPLAVYATVPFVALFGLNELAVRLPSVLFGTATVGLMYVLVTVLFAKPREVQPTDRKKIRAATTAAVVDPTVLGLLSAFFLAVSPWHVNISRAGFEANIALFFVVLGVILILRAFRNPGGWPWAFLPFAAAIYTFNSARYAVVMLGAGIFVLNFRLVRNQWRRIGIGAAIGLIALVPILPHLASKEARLRFAEVNIFSDAGIVNLANERIAAAHNAWWANIFYNRRVGYARSFAMHFLDHFEPWYLFIRGDGNPKFSIQDVGQLYLADAPLVAVGAVVLFSTYPAVGWMLVLWMVASILPAAVARETPHALRTLNSIPVWMIVLSLGAVTVFRFAMDRLMRLPVGKWLTAGAVTAGVALYAFNIGYYLHNYYRHYPIEYSHEWEYGYREAVRYAAGVAGKYDAVYMTDIIGRPYMYALFYLKYDPATYLREKKSYFDAAGFYHVTAFGKYRFPAGAISADDPSALYIVPAGEVPDGGKTRTIIRLLDDRPVLTIVDRK